MELLKVVYFDSENDAEWSYSQPVRPIVGDMVWLPDSDGEAEQYSVVWVTLDLHAEDFEITCGIEKV